MRLESVQEALARGVPVTRCPRGAFGYGPMFAGDTPPRIRKTASAESYRQRTRDRVAGILKRKLKTLEYGSAAYKVVEYRLRLGISSKALADAAEVGHGTVTDLENGRSIAGKKLKRILAEVEGRS